MAFSIGELAKRARLSKQAMTTMLRLLEKVDLVTRRPDPEDARASRVFLTKKSQRFRPVAEAALKELDALAKDVAGPRAHDASTRLAQALHRILSRMECPDILRG